MNEADIRNFYEQYFFYILAAQILIGFIFGLIPFVIGRRRSKMALGMIGLVAATVLGAFSPLLAILVALVFTFLVTRGSKLPPAPQAEDQINN